MPKDTPMADAINDPKYMYVIIGENSAPIHISILISCKMPPHTMTGTPSGLDCIHFGSVLTDDS